MAEFCALQQPVTAHVGEFLLRVAVGDDGETTAVVELNGEPVVTRKMTRHDDGTRIEVEYLGEWATNRENTVTLDIAGGVVSGRALGDPIGPISRTELDAEMVSRGVAPASYANDLQAAAEGLIAQIDALAAVDPQWKLPKPGCKFCTAKCSALGVACVAGCAGTGPLATICAAGCAAAGVDCVTDCPCD